MSPFLGRGWQFPVHFDPGSKQAGMVSGLEDIEESLRILLGTQPGERVMLPEYGCGLRRMVFEALSEGMLAELKAMIRKAVLFFEPRILLERIDVDVEDARLGRLDVLLVYTLRTTNTRHNLVYPLYLDQASTPVDAY
ncbi:GPW/gp25 family protein [Paludibacterium purpuratum]|uniref:IraD/Gp25-like domain-containing protein n=1 Tax=Paludibacterium purpuratum TaxID=1144873 RepID=A0A4R7BFE6_9NEIS|nr:GPW/gp25 family protein [Paludibacterium purpuratum]TDR82775.1 hypothetical protein DFP86_101164 [Paludibacterium purpuratum]